MSLLLGIVILALAVILGGLAAGFRERAHRAMPAVRTFAVVAAASVALLHLLPEAIAEVGLWAVLATGVGLVGPVAIERAIPARQGHHHEKAPTTALAIGYAAVVAHQAGEGAAVATLARTGALTLSVILAIAAHTVPLAMVVAIRVLEVRGGRGARRATGLALAGVALATVAGAFAGNLVGAARLEAVEPWILATIAGVLLHALAHDPAAPAATPPTRSARVLDAAAGLVGLVVALVGVEEHGWTQLIPVPAQVAGIALVAAAIIARSFRRPHAH